MASKQISEKKTISVVMFDYFGHGESDGLSEEFTLAACFKDFEQILYFLKEKGYSEIILWGIRTGSALVQQVVRHKISITKIFHWAPIFDLYGYVEMNLRGSVACQYMLFKRTVAKREEIIKDLLQYGKIRRKWICP